jgi:hypothetical protein
LEFSVSSERIRCRAFLGHADILGELSLTLLDESGSLARVETFLSSVREQQAKKGELVPLEVDVKVWKKPRSQRQLALYWMILERIAWVEGVSPEMVHEGIKEQYYPRIYYDHLMLPKHPLNAEEMSVVIEHAIAEAAEKGASLADLWVLWVTDEEAQARLEGSYASIEEYKARHPFCEACGLKHGRMNIAHITSVGAGGPDEPWNVLYIGEDHHIGEQHAEGWGPFLAKYPHLRWKVKRAQERGKA